MPPEFCLPECILIASWPPANFRPLLASHQIALSPASPTLLYVSSFGEFCPSDPNGAIYAVELDAASGGVARSAVLVSGLHDAQGIDVAPNGTLYIATGGNR